jgi:hypothetical protein
LIEILIAIHTIKFNPTLAETKISSPDQRNTPTSAATATSGALKCGEPTKDPCGSCKEDGNEKM